MPVNLNNIQSEYNLYSEQTEELIDIYGLTVKYVKSDNQNLDEIFGEYSHKKLNQNDVYEVNVMPENSENFDVLGNTFSKFGFTQTETFNCYIHKNQIKKFNYDDVRSQCVGDIIILPNNKKFEITFVEHEVQGLNNMFTYSNEKNVYMFKAKLYNYNGDIKEKSNEIEEDKLQEFNFTKLDEIFNVNDDNTSSNENQKEIIKKSKRSKNIKKESEKIKLETNDVFGEWG